ncbi:uncharacterized protein LOC62_05G007666 [Vanrija pseudolonga]|uniref:Uncharacterized protein n=1 Tax=Vanrija pseudolonga TaxID=143232 RepID=A0AAF0YCF1_9TREE|nr:hypothetical protein LOC62_05G007666 [Vanrija pseudolonga]
MPVEHVRTSSDRSMMVYFIGILFLLFFVLIFWVFRLARHQYRVTREARQAKKNPTLLPVYAATPFPTFGSTAALVCERLVPPDAAEQAQHGDTPPMRAAGRRVSIYGHDGVNRAHPEVGSDPELPSYTEDPSASKPLLICDDEFPPPPTPPPEAHVHHPPRGASPAPVVRTKSRRDSTSAMLTAMMPLGAGAVHF